MTDYDSMSVDELRTLYNWRIIQNTRDDKLDDIDVTLMALWAALRKAVIRESSVGEISIEQHEGYMSPDPMFTVGTMSKLKAGEFYLVPKEKGYAERLRDSVTDEINGEDIDPTPD